MQMPGGPTNGNVPAEFEVHFPPYYSMSDADKANLRQQVALSDQIYLNAGVITPMEVRASRYGGTVYDIDTTLHQEEEDRLLAKRELEHEAALQGFEGQRQALENNAEAAQVEDPQEEVVEDMEEIMSMNGLTMHVGPSNGIYRPASVVHPDGQRNDSEPVVLIGGRTHDRKLYRGYLKRDDEVMVPGPLLMGFYSSRSASRALKHYCEDEEVCGIEQLQDADIAHLKVTFDRYDKAIEYAGHTFPGDNKPIRTPDHGTKSHAVLAKEGDQVKLIRFGQQGVKGSPKSQGESEASRKRRSSFMARHAKNIKKGKMSAAYWSAKTKW